MQPDPIQPGAATPDHLAHFAISASFTAEPIEAALRFWSRRLAVPFATRFAPYNQLLQTLHDPAGEFAQNPGGLNLILLRVEDLGQFHTVDSEALRQVDHNLHQLTDTLHDSAGKFAAALLLIVCPPTESFDSGDGAGFSGLWARRLKKSLTGVRNLTVLDWEDLYEIDPVERPLNPEGDRLGRIAYTEEYFAALATAAVRHWDALSRPPYKVIAVDCDQTLWAGICGEDGPEGVRLDAPRRWLQEFLLRQREAGMLLAIASKNNEKDVLDTFAVHPEFPLRPEHLTAWRMNWQPKENNLISLADELNVGLDSLIFIDDNPKECAEVAGATPEVLTIPLPADASQIPSLLPRVWAFDHPIVTEEDRRRSELYEQGRGFEREARSATSLEEFIQKLGLAVHVSSLQAEKLPRTAQLTQRTNQFNTTTIRRTEAELEALVKDPRWSIYTATVADRFGDYGLTGVLITERRAKELWIDGFLLSCRVLGRGVEHRIMRFAGQAAFDLGLETVAVPYRETQRNEPARQFLASVPGGVRETVDGTAVYRFGAVDLGKLSYQPPATPLPAASGQARKSAGRRFNGYVDLALDLGSARLVLDALRGEYAAGQAASQGSDAPATVTEKKLSAIWAELLHRSPIGAGDNFFDLGGHSLLAVLLLMRIKEDFGVELSVDDVYSATLTLSGLAQTIEAAQAAGVTGEDYDELIKEIEGLSEEEVRELLEQARAEEPGQG